MRLPHRNRQTPFPGPIELAEPRVPVTARMKLDIFVPQHLQRDVLAFQFAVHRRPVGFGPIALTAAGRHHSIELQLERRVRQSFGKWPGQLRRPETLEHHTHARAANARQSRHLPRWQSGVVCQSQNLAHLAHRNSLRRHWPLLQKKQPATTGAQRQNNPHLIAIISERRSR